MKNKLGQYKSALAACNESICLNPDDAWPYANRGFAKIKLDRLESALTDCTKAIRLGLDYAEAYYTRGNAQIFLSRIQEAKADFQKALELAEQSGNPDLKTEIEQSVQELDNTQ